MHNLSIQFLIYDNLTPQDIIMKITQEDNRQGKRRDNYFSKVVESYSFHANFNSVLNDFLAMVFSNFKITIILK